MIIFVLLKVGIIKSNFTFLALFYIEIYIYIISYVVYDQKYMIEKTISYNFLFKFVIGLLLVLLMGLLIWYNLEQWFIRRLIPWDLAYNKKIEEGINLQNQYLLNKQNSFTFSNKNYLSNSTTNVPLNSEENNKLDDSNKEITLVETGLIITIGCVVGLLGMLIISCLVNSD